jgi:hypothetical protein
MEIGSGTKRKEAGGFGGRILQAVIGSRIFRGGNDSPQTEDHGHNVGDLLDGLPSGFFVLHGIRSRKGPIDHVLVGPKGIFVLKIRANREIITVFRDQIFRNGRTCDGDRELMTQIRQECRAVQELLAGRGITEPKPQPLIVFMNATVGVQGTSGGMEILDRNALPAFMKARKDVISSKEAEGIFEYLKIGNADSPL